MQKELEEKIMLLESQYKNEIGYLKIELSRKDKDFKFRKQDEYNSVKNNYNNNNSILQNIESDKESFSEKKKKEKPEKDIKEIKNEIEKFERKVVRDSERLNNTYRNNGELGESHQFIDKFKKVIDKLENRLEKMSSDIKVNNKNKNNISYELYDK